MTDTPKFEEIYNFFVDEGVWLEEQSKVENEAYKRCPLCQQMATSCESLMKRIAATLEVCEREIDAREEGDNKDAAKAYWTNRLAVEQQWYEVAKALVMEMYQKGHSADVLKTHPDLKRRASKPGATKAKLSKGQRKSKRRAERKARQRSRTHSRAH
jgi:hypothetical protein